MYDATFKLFGNSDIIVMAAAVADYTPENPKHEKIKKNDDGLILKLTKTKDILEGPGN